MKLLAIDTSGETCSAALLQDGTLTQRLETAPRRHAELILPMMQQLVDEAGLRLADLDALAFARGPGSFTGVRIAASVIQGVAFGVDQPVIPVSTLAAIAQGAYRRSGHTRLLVALDARMDEVYWGAFEINEAGLAEARGSERVCAPEAVPAPEGEGWYGVGPGWAAYAERLRPQIGTALAGVLEEGVCEARDLAVLAEAEHRLGHEVVPELAIPVYLRDQVTRKG
ncbi:tRNA (adenosine(37)-N6)-threonylcarbamoyltransferase complex dimerization subunit type 1 TsaB [Marichromatium sp. AB32]|uniref:tRNA (adenosine(37)-N6)-threonylcarbamoyltransferase complex dimerization subunit type 1 TsaB n=1 Tax=Marichromatium sp. AB32 TaxID=2483363 RepID=UPI000F3B04D9|nr:tRNA (adenosine(37)-N6)-threonylcarbamoyltransferase complex dimerization subunit type 1 TsaB [Marichromatium sp. AB32]MBO8085693.1 tRNA (adenosine(37)-N6)-threonylcarbamoyltransferase complex dimerization subunit type 1 TsaB [Marichromatium sp.]RNE92780.1 tRNA (adenosine(37)-N6)-threonylcarbamoyltransferase complex dimerization subunit type 1 TsaB [Marichromatium sp. AB32]